MELSWSDRKFYISQVWTHYKKARLDPVKFLPTAWWDCVKCSLAIALKREKPEILDFDWYYNHPWFDPENHTLAWFDFGKYETDYGTGTSWDYLVLGPRLTFAVGSDGSL